LHLTTLQASVLRFPAVVRLLGDAVGATQIGDLASGLAFLDDRQDLLVGELAPFHRASSESGGPSFYAGRIIGGRSTELSNTAPEQGGTLARVQVGCIRTRRALSSTPSMTYFCLCSACDFWSPVQQQCRSRAPLLGCFS